MFDEVVSFIKSLFPNKSFIPLHEPCFAGNEKKYVTDCIDSTFVSSVGAYVTKLEEMICEYTGSKYAVAAMNGTAALHMALILAGVERDDEVLTQALTFVATANAIAYAGASPIFVDSAKDNMGLCPEALKKFLKENTEIKNGVCVNKTTGRKIKACVPMHVFGHPVKLDEIIEVCREYNILVIEDAAESLGSFYKGKHTGTIAPIGILSFNGNKIATCGGGGMLLIQDEQLAKKAKHLTTTAKRPHPYEFFHDQIGYNYRLPNLNAALACAQIEQLPKFVESKRNLANEYERFFEGKPIQFVKEDKDSSSNYWLNAVLLKDRKERDAFLKTSNDNGVMTRPIWILMNKLPAFENCQKTNLTNAEFYEDRVVNIPSSVRL